MIHTTLRQSSSAGARIDLSSVRFQCDMTNYLCGLRHPMKLVPFATRVRMGVMAFPTVPSLQLMALSNCVSYAPDVFSCHARSFVFKVLVRNCEDESRILHDVHRNTIMSSRDAGVTHAEWSPGKRISSEEAGGNALGIV
ncbi:hypothetical protein T05_5824 [Trichinella murrelli]|uniref:Uncharacterized protein n=1 Tax=Trichinella murrelli TaxID=144512 RepID=A0A0V0T3C5_9BILA|nr:hypothetical protein T05_5824 [Trichinella murrelli]